MQKASAAFSAQNSAPPVSIVPASGAVKPANNILLFAILGGAALLFAAGKRGKQK
jgi:hypothetical protein